MSASSVSAAPLPAALLDWWFSPWTHAVRARLPALATGLMAQRDDYRGWCRRHGIPADLPVHYDAAWQVALLNDGEQLLQCAGWYGGLFAARERDRASLLQLPGATQRWCLKVALTQPLQALAAPSCANVRQRGLAELAIRLERGFPGMWPRLALMLPQELAPVLPQQQRSDSEMHKPVTDQRALRCWGLCLTQMRATAAAR